MMKCYKPIALLLTGIMCLNILAFYPELANANTVTSDTYSSSTTLNEDIYDQKLNEALDAYNREAIQNGRSIQKFSTNSEPAVIGSLIRLIFKNLVSKQTGKAAASVTVKATNKQILTKVTAHAIEEAVKDGITSLMIDNILANKPAGVVGIEKFEDHTGGSRIMYDRTSKLTVVLSKATNTIITIYKDNGKTTIQDRLDSGRWVRSNFKYQ
ncbi:DUF4258 domain-containing protein [Paenibacillus sp. Z6-24]